MTHWNDFLYYCSYGMMGTSVMGQFAQSAQSHSPEVRSPHMDAIPIRFNF